MSNAESWTVGKHFPTSIMAEPKPGGEGKFRIAECFGPDGKANACEIVQAHNRLNATDKICDLCGNELCEQDFLNIHTQKKIDAFSDLLEACKEVYENRYEPDKLLCIAEGMVNAAINKIKKP